MFNILDNLEARKVYDFCYLDRMAALNYAYKKEYDMINESQLSATEFGLVTMSDKTNGLYELNPRARRIRMFKQLEVNKYYGLDLVQFLKLDRATCDIILEDLQNDVIQASKIAAKREQELKIKEREAQQQRQSSNLNGTRWPGSN